MHDVQTLPECRSLYVWVSCVRYVRAIWCFAHQHIKECLVLLNFQNEHDVRVNSIRMLTETLRLFLSVCPTSVSSMYMYKYAGLLVTECMAYCPNNSM
jgi:hypothetical protein